jgi:hypothetical protein
MTKRKACATALTSKMTARDLGAAGVTRVLAGNWPGDMDVARTSPLLKRVDGNSTFSVYAVRLPQEAKREGLCVIPDGS